MPRTIIIWSLLLVANNSLHAFGFSPYVDLKRQYPVWILFYLALPALAIAFLKRLQRNDYARYLKHWDRTAISAAT